MVAVTAVKKMAQPVIYAYFHTIVMLKSHVQLAMFGIQLHHLK